MWEVGASPLYTVGLGYVRTDGLETPIEGSTLDTCERSIQGGNTSRYDSTC